MSDGAQGDFYVSFADWQRLNPIARAPSMGVNCQFGMGVTVNGTLQATDQFALPTNFPPGVALKVLFLNPGGVTPTNLFPFATNYGNPVAHVAGQNVFYWLLKH